MRFEDIATEVQNRIKQAEGEIDYTIHCDEPVVIAVNFLGGLISTAGEYPWKIAHFQNIPGDPVIVFNFHRLIVFDFPKDKIPKPISEKDGDISIPNDVNHGATIIVFEIQGNVVLSESLSDFLKRINDSMQKAINATI